MTLRITSDLLNIRPSSVRYRVHEREVAAFGQKYLAYSGTTLLHVIPGVLLLVLAPLQFSSSLRQRHVGFHRWSGRMTLVLLIPTCLSAFFFALDPFGGVAESLATAAFGGLLLYASVRAWMAIRRGEVTDHREWMIRMLAVAVGVSTIRVVGLVLLIATKASPQATFSPSLWIGWSITVGFAEWWIRFTRRARSTDGAGRERWQSGAYVLRSDGDLVGGQVRHGRCRPGV